MNQLRGIIDRSEGDFYVIKFNGDQEIYWPKNNAGFIFNDGDAVNLNLSTDEKATNEKEGEAKDLLRQIFQTNA